MFFTEQDKNDLIRGLMGLTLFVCTLLMVCWCLSNAMGIQFDHARHLVSATVTIFCLLYLVRDVFSTYKQILLSLCAAIFLIGAYGTAAELYVKHFTLFGLGELPTVFNWLYFSVFSLSVFLAAFFIKRDFFTC